jgi:capsular exopolysaccharide synthesis family protein
MSRIFEALQRSETERSGVQAEPSEIATELLQAVERGVNQRLTPPSPAAVVAPTNEFADRDLSRFQSLPVSIAPDAKLICLTAQDSLGAEKFRFLGVRLRQIQLTRPLKKILITSTIPEEGKSTVSANLSAILARRKQQKTLLIEGDLRRPSLCQRFGVGRVPGLSEWLQGEPRPLNSVYHLEGLGLYFLPAGRPPENPLELMQSGRLTELMNQLSAGFDWIIIDSPPVLPLADTSVWARMADGILLVTREGTTKKRLLQRGLQVLESSKLLGVVLNSSSNADHVNYYQRYGPGTTQKTDTREE